MDPVRLSQILSNGESISYYDNKVVSNEPVLLLIHGNFSSASNWIDLYYQLPQPNRIIAPDLRGFGFSTYYQKIQSVNDFSLDLLELLTKLKITQVTILGWSLGGGVALELARLLGKKVHKLILLSSVGLNGFREFDVFSGLQLEDKTKQNATNWMMSTMMGHIQRHLILKNRILVQRTLRTFLFNNHLPQPKIEKMIIDQVMRQVNLFDVSKALLNYNFFEHGDKNDIVAPIYIWHGTDDIIVPVEEAKQTLKYFQPKAQLTLFPGAGHALMVEKPQKFFDELSQLLAN